MNTLERLKEIPPKAALTLLPLDQILPKVDIAGYFQYEKDFHPVYRNPSHHFILVESGSI